jgi:hypothetical protein
MKARLAAKASIDLVGSHSYNSAQILTKHGIKGETDA